MSRTLKLFIVATIERLKTAHNSILFRSSSPCTKNSLVDLLRKKWMQGGWIYEDNFWKEDSSSDTALNEVLGVWQCTGKVTSIRTNSPKLVRPQYAKLVYVRRPPLQCTIRFSIYYFLTSIDLFWNYGIRLFLDMSAANFFSEKSSSTMGWVVIHNTQLTS